MYDPTDERQEELFSLLVRLIRETPDKVAKQGLARIFEQTALFMYMAHSAGAPRDADALEDVLAEHWDEIEAMRDELAADALYAIQTQEF